VVTRTAHTVLGIAPLGGDDGAPPWEDPRAIAFYDALACDVLHFPHQGFATTRAPILFNPHDLQHRHLPAFFTPAEIERRERLYRAACAHATAVAVSSAWVRADVVAQYGIKPENIQVIPWGIDAADWPAPDSTTMQVLKARHALPDRFCLYPAVTWPHKNHLRLVEALALGRAPTTLVCTGNRTDHWSAVEQRIAALGLADRVISLGPVSRTELRALYELAGFVVVPTLFEASSALLREAWLSDRPVACSRVTSLPDQAGDAALLFDPMDPSAIAAAIDRLESDEGLRRSLAARGRARVALFRSDVTARAYRALYRRVAGRALSRDEQALLATDWMRAPCPSAT
jgi:glycosyltransferase involved in cell wall biosynthesis